MFPHRPTPFTRVAIAVVLIGFGTGCDGPKAPDSPQSTIPHGTNNSTSGASDLVPLPKTDASEVAQRLTQEADALAGAGRFAEAVDKLTMAVKEDSEDEEILFNLAFYESKAGRTNDAIGHYRSVITLSPKYTEAHNNLGNIYLKLNDLQNARTSFQEAIRLNPKHSAGHNNLGIVFAREGRLPEAVQQFEEATRIKADYTEAWVNLGNALFGQGRLNEAIAPYQAALRIQPGMPAAVDGLRRIQVRLGPGAGAR